MLKITIAPNNFLNGYILNTEFSKIANISSNTYLFWKNIVVGKFENSRVSFLLKESIPQKYISVVKKCTNLDGLVLSSTFCSFTGLPSSHLTKSNGSKIYDMLEISEISGIKFVNLKKFYDDLNLNYNFIIYIEKCKFFSPTPFEKRIKISDTLCLGYY